MKSRTPFWKGAGQKTSLLSLAVLLALTGCRTASNANRTEESGSVARKANLVLYPVTDPDSPLIRFRDTTDEKAGSDASVMPVPEAARWLQSLNLSDPNSLAPASSGAGILCCEPIAKTEDAALTAFGAGCGRWLQFTVGGQGALGKTPLWSSLFRVEEELKRADLRLSPDDTEKLVSILGITHAATGELTGTAQNASLTYRLLELPARRPVGEPMTLTGTQAQIIAGLPSMARQMALRLRVAHPAIPAAVGANPAEMRLLGSLPLLPGAPLSSMQSKSLRVLAPRLPLAGMMRLHSGDWQDKADADAMIKSR